MNIEYFENYARMSSIGASIALAELKKKSNLLLCTATGSSPLGLYKELVDHSQTEEYLFRQLRIIKLDEWIGLKNEDGTCEQYLRANLIKPLQISKERYLAFDSFASDPKNECERIQAELDKTGPIDLCILGLGKNGHLGFNEPGLNLQAHCHVSQLDSTSQYHAMLKEGAIKPEYGMTLGMEDILSAKKIILLVSGEGKQEAREDLLSAKVSSRCPASFLWRHNNVDCLIEGPSISRSILIKNHASKIV